MEIDFTLKPWYNDIEKMMESLVILAEMISSPKSVLRKLTIRLQPTHPFMDMAETRRLTLTQALEVNSKPLRKIRGLEVVVMSIKIATAAVRMHLRSERESTLDGWYKEAREYVDQFEKEMMRPSQDASETVDLDCTDPLRRIKLL
jgi:hypothetical protein